MRIAADLDTLRGDIERDCMTRSEVDWAQAARVHAWVHPQQGKRDFDEKSSKLAVTEFANLKIRGLSTRDSVRKYWNAWDKAVKEGLAVRAEPGRDVELPTVDFSEYVNPDAPRGGGGSKGGGDYPDYEGMTPEEKIAALKHRISNIAMGVESVISDMVDVLLDSRDPAVVDHLRVTLELIEISVTKWLDNLND